MRLGPNFRQRLAMRTTTPSGKCATIWSTPACFAAPSVERFPARAFIGMVRAHGPTGVHRSPALIRAHCLEKMALARRFGASPALRRGPITRRNIRLAEG